MKTPFWILCVCIVSGCRAETGLVTEIVATDRSHAIVVRRDDPGAKLTLDLVNVNKTVSWRRSLLGRFRLDHHVDLSAMTIARDRAIMTMESHGRSEVVAVALGDGNDAWRIDLGAIQREPGSRVTMALLQDPSRTIHLTLRDDMGPSLRGIDPASGELRWSRDLDMELGGLKGAYVEGGRIVLIGRQLLFILNAMDGSTEARIELQNACVAPGHVYFTSPQAAIVNLSLETLESRAIELPTKEWALSTCGTRDKAGILVLSGMGDQRDRGDRVLKVQDGQIIWDWELGQQLRESLHARNSCLHGRLPRYVLASLDHPSRLAALDLDGRAITWSASGWFAASSFDCDDNMEHVVVHDTTLLAFDPQTGQFLGATRAAEKSTILNFHQSDEVTWLAGASDYDLLNARTLRPVGKAEVAVTDAVVEVFIGQGVAIAP